MRIHILTGQGVPASSDHGGHLPTKRPRSYRSDCQWDALPVDVPPAPLVKHYFTTWTADGTLNRIPTRCATRSATWTAEPPSRPRR